jgi:hypothetical protein
VGHPQEVSQSAKFRIETDTATLLSSPPSKLRVLGHSSTRYCFVLIAAFSFSVLSGTTQALPIKLKLEDVIKDAKKPVENYPPARAGWNGPEEKSAVQVANATYDRLRKSITPEAVRMQFLQAAKPDWRALLGLAGVIFCWRYKRAYSHPQVLQMERPVRSEVVPIISGQSVSLDERAA